MLSGLWSEGVPLKAVSFGYRWEKKNLLVRGGERSVVPEIAEGFGHR